MKERRRVPDDAGIGTLCAARLCSSIRRFAVLISWFGAAWCLGEL